MNNRPKVSLVLPAYNEEDNITLVIEETHIYQNFVPMTTTRTFHHEFFYSDSDSLLIDS